MDGALDKCIMIWLGTCPWPIALSNVVFKNKDEAAIRWNAEPYYYSESDKRILTIIHQAQLYVSTKGHSLANKVGYLEEALNSIENAVKLQGCYEKEK